MLFITTLGVAVLAARLTEKDALQVVRDSISFPEFDEDQLVQGDTPNERIHRYHNPLTRQWVDSGYKITSVPNPMTQHAHEVLQEALQQLANGEAEKTVVGYEWGVRIQDASGIERILDPDSIKLTAENRLERYRETWPTARLVRRPVYNEPWEEVADAD